MFKRSSDLIKKNYSYLDRIETSKISSHRNQKEKDIK